MTTEFEPPQYPAEITDKWALQEMARVRNYRQTKNINFPRFVRALNQSGYAITLNDYKRAETHPVHAIPFVHDGLLDHCYKVLNAARVRGSVQGHHTEHAMQVIRTYRIRRNLDFLDMAERLTDRGITTSVAEYRTAEQGITKNVSFEVIAECVRLLGIDFGELFDTTPKYNPWDVS